MNKKGILHIGFCCLVISSVALSYLHYYDKWKCNWEKCPKLPIYIIKQPKDNILRIGMIGDSWAYLHHSKQMDFFLRKHLARRLKKPVSVISKGRNGEITREIYKYMFSDGIDGTRSIIENGLDYCIISAGINDACKNLGVKQYTYHYRLIINFLLSNNICPIVIEIPNANVWDSQFNKPIKEVAVDYIRSIMTNSPMYDCEKYRNELRYKLVEDGLMKSIIYIPLSEWNGTELKISKELSLTDQIHLNQKGYEKLDSSIINAIIKRENPNN